ncbi:UNVERIFIED_CONTAM: hypothetical protein FKN15_066938, partial [Acipenser sinensis]
DWLASLNREQQEAQLQAKAKRRQRKSSSRDSGRESFSENVDVVVVRPGSPTIRVFDRKCRSGKGRGLPKKGGSGGKGVWGAPPEVYDLEDPSYEDAQEGETVCETVVLELDDEEFNKTVTPIIQEYFELGDTNEVLALLEGLTLGRRKYEIPFLAVNLPLDGKASHWELTSCLLTNLVGKCLSSGDVAVAFDALLEALPELILDTPAAPQVTLNRAAVLLSMKRGVDNVWGVGRGQRPVKELVKEAVVKAVESMNRESPKRIMKLLKSFWESGLVTADQMIQGFKRVFSMTQDLHLDIPNCYPALESFVELCYLEGVISKQLHDHCPTEQE